MTTPTEPQSGTGLVVLGILAFWGWFTFTYCPPLFVLLALGAVCGVIGAASGGGGNYPDQNCGPGGPDAY